MTIVFCALALLLAFFSWRSFRGGLDYLNFVRNEVARPRPDFAPFTTVIVPCKGIDDGLEANLEALIVQDRPAYEVIFVVDDENDPAAGVIKKVIGKSSVPVRMIVAEKAIVSSQKIENLRTAVTLVNDASAVFAFVDSDARPSKNWLRDLVAPLQDPDVGASTAYRWFLSPTDSFAGEMRSVWNASIASALGPNTATNFCWGGSMAIRRDVFERLGISEKWVGALSDDFTVTRCIRAAGMPIHFVPTAMTPSMDDCDFSQLIEFTTRQMKITRVYAPHLWKLSFFGSGLFTVVMVWSFAVVIFSGTNSWVVLSAISAIFLVTAFSIGKALVRLRAVTLAMPEHSRLLRRQMFTQCTLWLLAPPLFLLNSVTALLSRKMIWRGIEYEMVSPTETLIRRQ
ncbi:MAG: glycosyltransferase family 2 protein [Acidobacteriota bacterium]